MVTFTACLLLAAATGSASASHSVLCKENVSVCPGGSQYPAELEPAGSASAEVPGTFAEVKIPGLTTLSCSVAKVVGAAHVNKEGPMTGMGRFASGLCSPEGCGFHSVGEHSWEWKATGGGDGAIVMSEPILEVVCTKSPNITCDYSVSSLTAEFEGGPWQEAFIADEGTTLEKVGGFALCGLYKEANFRFRFFVVSPGGESSVYLTN